MCCSVQREQVASPQGHLALTWPVCRCAGRPAGLLVAPYGTVRKDSYPQGKQVESWPLRIEQDAKVR